MNTKLKFLMEGLKKCITATGKKKEQLQKEMVLFLKASDPEEIFGGSGPSNAKEADEMLKIISELLPLLKDGLPREYDKHKALFDGLSLMFQGVKEIRATNVEQGLPELPSLADLKQELVKKVAVAKENPKGIIVRIMTKNKGIHQHFFKDLSKDDVSCSYS